MNTAKQIWDDLAVRFSQHTLSRLFYIRKNLASLSQDNLSITDYFTKFRYLINKLDICPQFLIVFAKIQIVLVIMLRN